MIILPAIDIRQGKCVRLKQGAKEAMTIYHDDPIEMALQLEAEGAKYLHVVDLDGAFDGTGIHGELIRHMVQKLSIPVEVGGGIRTAASADSYIEAGVSRVIIGSMAVEDPSFVDELVKKHGKKIAVSVDAKKGIVATRGWIDSSGVEAVSFIKNMKKRGVKTFIYTDIGRDGMLQGPNLKELKEVQQLGDLQLIASGGISSVEDLEAIANLGIYGAITGTAIYEERITMKQVRQIQEARYVG